MIFLLLFLLSAGLNILLGLHFWPAVLAGNLPDPESYLRLLRLEQGIHAGHLTAALAHHGPAPYLSADGSRLLDVLLWLIALPLAAFLGWHWAIYAAGLSLGPLGVGALGAALAWAVAPFSADKHLWSTAAAGAILPGLLAFALPGMIHPAILLLALIAAAAGCAARARFGDNWQSFLCGICAGFAVWLTPQSLPFALALFAALLLRWLQLRLSIVLASFAAGFFDVLILGLMVDPPAGGYGDPATGRLSYVFVALALLLLACASAIWRLEGQKKAWLGPFCLALLAATLLGWTVWLVSLASHGVVSMATAAAFFSVPAPAIAMHGLALLMLLAPGELALAYSAWRALGWSAQKTDLQAILGVAEPFAPEPGQGRQAWIYLAMCLSVALCLGEKYLLFIAASATIAAALLPVALSDASQRLQARPQLAMLARLAILGIFFGVPEAAAIAIPASAGTAQPAFSWHVAAKPQPVQPPLQAAQK